MTGRRRWEQTPRSEKKNRPECVEEYWYAEENSGPRMSVVALEAMKAQC